MQQLQTALAERTADLQRLQAEYVNYKRRVDRDRDVARKNGVEAVLKDLMSVLDDVRSAREHGELNGGFKAVADELERVSTRHGLEAYGAKGDPFDPHIHEALLHSHAEGIDGPTCVEILQPGYKIGDRVAQVAQEVADMVLQDDAFPSIVLAIRQGGGQTRGRAYVLKLFRSGMGWQQAATEAADAPSDDEH